MLGSLLRCVFMVSVVLYEGHCDNEKLVCGNCVCHSKFWEDFYFMFIYAGGILWWQVVFVQWMLCGCVRSGMSYVYEFLMPFFSALFSFITGAFEAYFPKLFAASLLGLLLLWESNLFKFGLRDWLGCLMWLIIVHLGDSRFWWVRDFRKWRFCNWSW